MKTKKVLLKFILAISCLLFKNAVHGQHQDKVFFGDSTSEQKHGITSFKMTTSEVYTGPNSQKVRRFYPITITLIKAVK